MAAAVQSGDFRLVVQLDLGIVGDALNQVARHGIRQLSRAHQDVDLARGLGKIDGSLSGRVASADHDDVFVLAELRLNVGRTVVNSLPFEILQIGDGRLVVLGAGGNHNRPRGQRGAVVEHDFVRTAAALQLDHAMRDHHLRAKFLRLRERTIGELLARNSGRKAEIVFDLGA